MTWETISNLIHDEWMILSLLLLWSVAGLTIICERVYALWNVLAKSEVFKNHVIGASKAGICPRPRLLRNLERSLGRCLWPRPARICQDAQQDHRIRHVPADGRHRLVQALPVGTWNRGSSAPFVGLFGTVVGILKAFQSMSTAGTGASRFVSKESLPRWWRQPRACWSPSTPSSLQLLVLAGGRYRRRVQNIL